MNISTRRLGAAIVGGLLAALLAISGAQAQGENAAVRIVHAVPDGPAVDVYVDGNSVANGLSYFTASDYLSLAAGEHQVQVTAAGADPASAVISTTVSLEAGQSYTVMATGTADSIQPAVITDDRSIPTAGDTKIRFIHAVPGAPAVDVRRVGADVPLVSNLAFQQASDYLPLLPGSYDFNVVATGQTEVLFDFNQDLVADQPIYDIFLIGTLPNMRAEIVGSAGQGQAAQPTIQAATTASPAATAQATAQPTASPAATAQATAQPTASPAATAQPTATPPVAQLPNTGAGGQGGAPLALAALAALLLLGGGLLAWRQSR